MDQVWLWWKLDWGSHNLFNLMLLESSSPENISGASQRKKHSAEHRSKFKNIENDRQFTDNDFSAPTSDTMCKHFLHIIQLRVLIMSISRELDYTGQALWGHFSHSCFSTLKTNPHQLQLFTQCCDTVLQWSSRKCFLDYRSIGVTPLKNHMRECELVRSW